MSRLFGPDFITQKYLRRFPASRRAKAWAGTMVHIQTENGVWRTGGQGYTLAGNPDAWVLPFEEAVKKIDHCGPEKQGCFLRAGCPTATADDERPRYTTRRLREEIRKAEERGRQQEREAALSAAEPVSSIVPDHCSGTALSFEGGCLHVRKDGSGYIVVDEDDFKLEDDRCEGEHGPEGSVHWIARFPAGEMTALRNFLNGQDLPAPSVAMKALDFDAVYVIPREMNDEEWAEVKYNVDRKANPDIELWRIKEAVKYANFIAGHRGRSALSAQVQDVTGITIRLGIYGRAFDLPEERRAYTHEHQPANIEAYKLGRACSEIHSGGDWIDRGLNLLNALQREGFGVYELPAAPAKPEGSGDA